ncbi:MAG: helix-turn-helix domain-containing protein [Oscillospiraceae bacterium]|nr:helix-turn-helix domain-containing protein [Oscillospiraceae bacterium]
MAIYLNEKLKQFRKARDLTQEQVADIFNVSPQTVSRWETGTNCPDIEMLPALADFFEVTTDDLLGVDIAKKEERIIEILNEQSDAMANDSVDSQIKILRQGLQEFPNHYALLYRLAGALWGKAWELKEAGNKDGIKRYAEEAIKIFEQVISVYAYDGNRYSSMPILEQKYGYNYATVHYGAIHGTACAYKYFLNDTEKAVEWANKLPTLNNTREFVLSTILEDEKKPAVKYDFTKEYEQLKSVVAELEKYVKK